MKKKGEKHTEEDFWLRVEKSDNCWMWTGYKLNHSYGGFWINGKHYQAHRFSWMLHHGEIPQGGCILHRCDNPLCVNPSHLFLGTQQDNVTDMMTKGRGNKAKGENSARAKLSWDQVREIRARYIPRLVSQRILAKEFGVNVSTIQNILYRKTWKEAD